MKTIGPVLKSTLKIRRWHISFNFIVILDLTRGSIYQCVLLFNFISYFFVQFEIFKKQTIIKRHYRIQFDTCTSNLVFVYISWRFVSPKLANGLDLFYWWTQFAMCVSVFFFSDWCLALVRQIQSAMWASQTCQVKIHINSFILLVLLLNLCPHTKLFICVFCILVPINYFEAMCFWGGFCIIKQMLQFFSL